MTVRDTIADALAGKLGIAATAPPADFAAAFDKRLREERLVGACSKALGLPLDATGDDILAEVGKCLDARAKAVGLAAGAGLPEIQAAEAAAKKAAPPAPVPAASVPAAPRVPAASAEEIEEAAIGEAIDVFLRSPGAGSSNGRTPGEWSR